MSSFHLLHDHGLPGAEGSTTELLSKTLFPGVRRQAAGGARARVESGRTGPEDIPPRTGRNFVYRLGNRVPAELGFE